MHMVMVQGLVYLFRF